MEQLSSCYFCGAALDESLGEYPVVPRALQPEGTETQTVVLCAGCRQKLGTIVESVVDAATAAETSTAGTGADDAAESPSDLDAETGVLLEDGAVASADDDAAEPASAPDEGALEFDDGEGDAVAGTDSDPAPGEREDAAAAAGATDSGTGDDPPDQEALDAELTRLEYSKVMRLLQNREFPVDRAEIREVALSAYDIEPDEFDAITAAAVRRNLIGERDGQFVDPA